MNSTTSATFSISPAHPAVAEMTNPANEKVYSVCTVAGAIETPGATHLNTNNGTANTLAIHTSSDRSDFQ